MRTTKTTTPRRPGKVYKVHFWFHGQGSRAPLWKTPDGGVIGTLRDGNLVIWLETVIRQGIEVHHVVFGEKVGWYCGGLLPLLESEP